MSVTPPQKAGKWAIALLEQHNIAGRVSWRGRLLEGYADWRRQVGVTFT